jgi:hypothetical protein
MMTFSGNFQCSTWRQASCAVLRQRDLRARSRDDDPLDSVIPQGRSRGPGHDRIGDGCIKELG